MSRFSFPVPVSGLGPKFFCFCRAGILKIQLQLGRSFTRRGELRRPSSILGCCGKKKKRKPGSRSSFLDPKQEYSRAFVVVVVVVVVALVRGLRFVRGSMLPRLKWFIFYLYMIHIYTYANVIHIWSIYASYIYDPYFIHLWPICDPCVTHIWSICDPYEIHMWSIYDPYEIHVEIHIWSLWIHIWPGPGQSESNFDFDFDLVFCLKIWDFKRKASQCENQNQTPSLTLTLNLSSGVALGRPARPSAS